MANLTPDDVRRIATEVYQQLGSRFGVNQTPIHTHNGVDSPTLAPAALDPFQALRTTPGAIFAPSNIAGQNVSNPITGTLSFSTVPTSVYVAPVPYIEGDGVGVSSAFNGGEAPIGTIIAFANAGVRQLWWRIYNVGTDSNKWVGIDLSGGTGANTRNLGPID